MTTDQLQQNALDRAEIFFRTDDIRSAIEVLETESVNGADNLALLEATAQCYWKLGNFQHLEPVLRKMVSIHPYEPSYFAMLGAVLQSEGRIGEAIRSFEIADRMYDGENESIRLALATAIDYQNELIQSLGESDQQFRVSLRKSPTLTLIQYGFHPVENSQPTVFAAPGSTHLSLSARPS